MYDRVTDRKLVILTDIWIKTHDIAILNRLILIYLMIKAQGLGPATIKRFPSIKRTASQWDELVILVSLQLF